MTNISAVRGSIISLMVLAVLAATLMAEFVSQFLAQALTSSKTVRVAPLTSCQLSSDGTHFTGCSSIL